MLCLFCIKRWNVNNCCYLFHVHAKLCTKEDSITSRTFGRVTICIITRLILVISYKWLLFWHKVNQNLYTNKSHPCQISIRSYYHQANTFSMATNLDHLRNGLLLGSNLIAFEPVHDISNNVVCATSKGSDQPAHTCSLIRSFASRLNILWVLNYGLNTIWSF